MHFITVLCLNQVMLIGRDSKNPDVDSKDPWPRRGFVRLIGLVSMHLIMLNQCIFKEPLAQTWIR